MLRPSKVIFFVAIFVSLIALGSWIFALFFSNYFIRDLGFTALSGYYYASAGIFFFLLGTIIAGIGGVVRLIERWKRNQNSTS